MRTIRNLGVWLILVLACSTQAAINGLKISVDPVFFPPLLNAQGAPVQVTLANDGDNITGELKIETDQLTMRYPVELPSGAKKAWIAYTKLDYGSFRVSLNTNRGSESLDSRIEGQSSRGILLLGGVGGQLGFVQSAASQDTYSDLIPAYVRTEATPDRAIAFMGYEAVVLGEGAERLPDATLEAVKGYVLAGGCLIVPTGPGLPILQDKRLATIWGPQSVELSRIAGSRALAAIGGSPVEFAFGVTKGIRRGNVLHSEDGVPLVVEFRFGNGFVYILGFDPLDGPLTRWAGRSKLMRALIRKSDSGSKMRIALQPLEEDPYDSSGFSYYTPYSSSNVAPTSAFELKPPPASTVFLVLGIFIIVVIPINFLVLGAMKKREWAWFTSPIISLLFAIAFFRIAGQLYSFDRSVRTSAVVFADLRSDQAIAVGTNELFFPRGGRFDLGLKQVEQISIPNERLDAVDLRPVDTGSIQCPEVVMGSLTFTKISFLSTVDLGPLLNGFSRKQTPEGVVITLDPPPGLTVAPLVKGKMPIQEGRKLVWKLPKVFNLTPKMIEAQNKQMEELIFYVQGLRLGVTQGEEVKNAPEAVMVTVRMPEVTP